MCSKLRIDWWWVRSSSGLLAWGEFEKLQTHQRCNTHTVYGSVLRLSFLNQAQQDNSLQFSFILRCKHLKVSCSLQPFSIWLDRLKSQLAMTKASFHLHISCITIFSSCLQQFWRFQCLNPETEGYTVCSTSRHADKDPSAKVDAKTMWVAGPCQQSATLTVSIWLVVSRFCLCVCVCDMIQCSCKLNPRREHLGDISDQISFQRPPSRRKPQRRACGHQISPAILLQYLLQLSAKKIPYP